MKTECTPEPLRFHALQRREVTAEFDGGFISSDGGGLLLRETEERVQVLSRLAGCFRDYRDPDLVEHPVGALVKHLPLYIFCGHDLLCARLRTADQDAAAGALARLIHDLKAMPARAFGDFRYRTRKSWSCERRVVGKAEHLDQGENPRFVVTSLHKRRYDAKTLYEQVYCERGNMENRIKEQQLDLFADRTSTHRLYSNQLRLYFSSFAYVLLHALRRLGLKGTEMAQAQAGTIRLKLLKLGARVTLSVRRVRIAFSENYPWRDLFRQVLQQLWAIPARE